MMSTHVSKEEKDYGNKTIMRIAQDERSRRSGKKKSQKNRGKNNKKEGENDQDTSLKEWEH